MLNHLADPYDLESQDYCQVVFKALVLQLQWQDLHWLQTS
jgi:hypothetical protein